jgi:hypothetical protein
LAAITRARIEETERRVAKVRSPTDLPKGTARQQSGGPNEAARGGRADRGEQLPSLGALSSTDVTTAIVHVVGLFTRSGAIASLVRTGLLGRRGSMLFAIGSPVT